MPFKPVSLPSAAQHGHQAQQNIADVRNRRVRQQALDVGLGDGREIAQRERSDGHPGDDLDPAHAHRPEGVKDQPQQQRETGGLGGHADVRRDRRGRALIDVRRPLMEGHRRHLEEKPRRHGNDRQEHQQVRGPAQLERRAHHVEIGARHLQRQPQRPVDLGHGAHAVEQRKAVSQQSRTEGPQQQIFHRGFVRALLMAQKSGEYVKADGHGLQAEELHDQVVARGHEHHADRGEKKQRVILAVIFVFDLQVAHREQNHQRRGDQENHPEKQEEGIHHDRAIESAHGVRPQSRAGGRAKCR